MKHNRLVVPGLASCLAALHVMLILGTAYAQASEPIWCKILGDGEARAIGRSRDGGFVATGWIRPDPYLAPGRKDIYLVKLDSKGEVVWEKTLGSGLAYGIAECHDGGFVVSGLLGGEVTEQFYLLKVNEDGEKVWNRTYSTGRAWEVIASRWGGYLAAGHHQEVIVEEHGIGYLYSTYVLRLDEDGNLVWNRTYGPTGARGIAACTGEQEYVVVGGNSVLRIDREGEILWQAEYADEFFLSVASDGRGGFIAAGERIDRPYKEDVIHSLWARAFENGNTTWAKDLQRTSYGSAESAACSVLLSEDGNITIVGAGYYHEFTYIVKIDYTGRKLWEGKVDLFPVLGVREKGNAVVASGDGGYVVAGQANGRFCVFKIRDPTIVPIAELLPAMSLPGLLLALACSHGLSR